MEIYVTDENNGWILPEGFWNLQNLSILYSVFYSAVENNSKLFICTFEGTYYPERNYHQIFILDKTFTIENTSSIKHLT